MWRIIVNRLAFGAAIVLLITIVVFGLSRAAGDPRNIYLDEYATPEAWDAWGERMGLDKPLYVQYAVWLWDALRGDFGESLYYDVPSIRLVRERVPNTVQLGGVAFGVAILIGVPMGVISAVRRGTIIDYAVRGFALLGQSVPVFWIALMMILIFSLQLGWLPSSRNEGWNHFIMPAIALGWLPAAGLMRITRGAMLNILDSEYIKLARAKGVNSGRIVWVHGFRNAIIPPLTVAALIFAAFLTGTVVIETVFAWPGVGRLAVQSIKNNDFPVLSAIVILFSSFYIILNLVVDLLYAAFDPRIRLD
ncbi:MAG: ABC transporter permease [Chloroflexi bacterium]|nr:ABC transporter permease [Chloroflexota bacterium]